MDQKTSEGAMEQRVLDFKCKKMLHEGEKSTALLPSLKKESGAVNRKSLEPMIGCQTPEKINEPLHNKFHEGQVKLPEKYETLVEFFDCMNCSLRLLTLCKRLPTFGNISTQMGVLAQRNFSYEHLAQMKYILPEALQVERILIHDKRTLCMKPDMKITLLFDVVDGHSEVSDFIALSQVFKSRLCKFFTTHIEASDIPEAILPEPFTRRTEITIPDELPVDCNVKSQQAPPQTELFSEKFHPHFSPHFSQNAVVAETAQVLASVVIPPIDTVDKQDNKNEQQKKFVDPISVPNCVISQDAINAIEKNSTGTCSKSICTNPQLQSNHQSSRGNTVESPVVKLMSSNDSFMVETPLQSVPKKLVSSCDVSLKMIASQRPAPCCKPAKRALDFFHLEGDDGSALDCREDKTECDEVVCECISQIPKGISKEGNTHGSSSQPRESEEGLGFPSEVCNKSQTGELQHIPSSLVDMVALIRSIFKSVDCSPITKEELVHKIIMNSFDIVDKREVEEQIDVLERLVPDWIHRKLASSGDIMYNIKDVSDLESIRVKLISA